MKYIKISIVGLCVILLANGCSGSKGHPGVGFIPRIRAAQMDNANGSGILFKSGDQAIFGVIAEDTDQNMKTLWYTDYQVDSATPYNGPNPITLPKQTSESMTYSQLGPITLSGPAGRYRMDIQIEDASGNKTDVTSIDFNLQ
jgi:hypothetical protein